MTPLLPGYVISEDALHLNLDRIVHLLGNTYWASARSRETIERSMRNSICFGVYHGNELVAFARVVSDLAVMYWLCDVCVAEAHRGRGLGKALIRAILEDERFEGLAGLLATQDAHSLYEQFGFRRDGARSMYRLPCERTVQANAASQDRT
jgi:GNAT superfamily N-acetyltransferase